MKDLTLTVNEEEYTFTQADYDPVTGAYVKKFISPAETSYPLTNHYYPMEFSVKDDDDEELVIDDSDATFGDYMKLRVREIEAPIVVLDSPEVEGGVIVIGDGEVTVVFTVTDTGGSELDELNTVLEFGDNTYHLSDSALVVTAITDGYQIEFTPSILLSDGDYPLILKAYDHDENLTELALIIHAEAGNLSFIWDRTLLDVNRVIYLRDRIQTGIATALEKLEYSHDLKGARNRSDFERIINCMKYICLYYELAWDDAEYVLPEIPTETFVQKILTKVNSIRSNCPIHADTPYTPSLPLNTYQKMNDVEKILYDVWTVVKSYVWYYCDAGLIMDGEIGLLE